jgi:hypothetical protein
MENYFGKDKININNENVYNEEEQYLLENS